MPRLWRLTRNRYGRAVYDALARRGITATEMIEYVADLEDAPAADGGSRRSAYAVETCDPSTVAPLEAPVEELQSDELVVAALEDGRPRGYLFCSVDATHEIHPLERELHFEGAYIRRVFVDPDHRNRGIATALVGETCRLARERGAERATALVALDNGPSRALFERRGFDPRRRRRYVRVGPLSHRSVRPS
ncbi:GNAT family N-acetyltransferase [Haloterrigena sp. SYSU A558-1]|uniref:GNAT family N-acetyltransferase n=1 Tax=Haloterrigena gelatinilytica TaxID=2741724 RepID=A0ABX2LGT7_9EURY|nr:GNAT family N-acetyltransferase [Haloterrigena gelatinilytica]NUC74578.1 GNAT family N-acetyltransferase [Haloterrigena gelatinilytica]